MLKYAKTGQIYLFKGIFPTDVPSVRGCFSYLEFVKIRYDNMISGVSVILKGIINTTLIIISIEGLMYFCGQKK